MRVGDGGGEGETDVNQGTRDGTLHATSHSVGSSRDTIFSCGSCHLTPCRNAFHDPPSPPPTRAPTTEYIHVQRRTSREIDHSQILPNYFQMDNDSSSICLCVCLLSSVAPFLRVNDPLDRKHCGYVL
ncbi:hypothetical protein J6590_014586 [Homalodisca vitripennis]|nr:hypothetical protein J6590_014586 [Homalodisca vitripennis]